MTTPAPRPTRSELERCFVAVLDGTRSREDVAAWAAPWHARPDAGVAADQVVWLALSMLSGVDTRIVPDGPYLHPDERVRQWLDAFRQVRATSPER
ncbi:hypothetical protein [Dactylosporangium sp. NPDC006015]|uniref:hypothetical protein n=1 Tax=Dactylosporangium sp. NPDC006015 TaxID=3154576 RepID=UPI0033B64359